MCAICDQNTALGYMEIPALMQYKVLVVATGTLDGVNHPLKTTFFLCQGIPINIIRLYLTYMQDKE